MLPLLLLFYCGLLLLFSITFLGSLLFGAFCSVSSHCLTFIIIYSHLTHLDIVFPQVAIVLWPPPLDQLVPKSKSLLTTAYALTRLRCHLRFGNPSVSLLARPYMFCLYGQNWIPTYFVWGFFFFRTIFYLVIHLTLVVSTMKNLYIMVHLQQLLIRVCTHNLLLFMEIFLKMFGFLTLMLLIIWHLIPHYYPLRLHRQVFLISLLLMAFMLIQFPTI